MKTSIIWRGLSQLDGITPLMVLLVPDSGNVKTGPMWQTYIIRSDVRPLDAIKARETQATCGTCPLQQAGCYSERTKGLISIGAFMTGKGYPQIPLDAACAVISALGATLRIGAYGDPAAVPVEVWAALASAAQGRHTGYTHQWRTCAPELREYVMASCDSAEDADDAQAMGWRTFRIRQVSSEAGVVEPTRANELVCPASQERDLTTCDTCRMCDGLGKSATRRNVAIIDHSTRALAIRRRTLKIFETAV
jgi:hypothetical protein